MCKIDNCNIRPTFNFEGESKALYCSAHKKDEWTQRLKTLEEHINYWINPTIGHSSFYRFSIWRSDN